MSFFDKKKNHLFASIFFGPVLSQLNVSLALITITLLCKLIGILISIIDWNNYINRKIRLACPGPSILW